MYIYVVYLSAWKVLNLELMECCVVCVLSSSSGFFYKFLSITICNRFLGNR